jgi:hypothetical protein
MNSDLPSPAEALPSIAAADAGLRAPAAQRALDFAVETGARQLMVVVPEGMVAEAYAAARPDDTFDVFSVQKSVFALLFGILCARGLANANEPQSDLLGAGWPRIHRAAETRVRIPHVLTITTGISDQLQPLGILGDTWRYNNVAYGVLKAGLWWFNGSARYMLLFADRALPGAIVLGARWTDNAAKCAIRCHPALTHCAPRRARDRPILCSSCSSWRTLSSPVREYPCGLRDGTRKTCRISPALEAGPLRCQRHGPA